MFQCGRGFVIPALSHLVRLPEAWFTMSPSYRPVQRLAATLFRSNRVRVTVEYTRLRGRLYDYDTSRYCRLLPFFIVLSPSTS